MNIYICYKRVEGDITKTHNDPSRGGGVGKKRKKKKQQSNYNTYIMTVALIPHIAF